MAKHIDDGLPDQITAGDLAARGMQVVDGHGKPIERVITADRAAGTVTRYAVEDGNLVIENDAFKTTTEERAVRFVPLQPVTADEMVGGGDASEQGDA